jgi:4-amino-4-deoxy-L-arabinose transferase-like glycosyltransferase
MLTTKRASPTALQDSQKSELKRLPKAAEKWAILAAALLAIFYFVTSVQIASHRLFWFDEFFTVRMAQLPAWTMIWTALNHAADSLPPFYYMLVRAFGTLFGKSEVVARMPSTLAMVAGLLLTFDCARRLTDGLHGLIALSALTCSFLPYYGYEARSYAIYFMFAALGLWVWTKTASGLRSAIFFGAALFLAVTMHYYAVMCLAPYALWELIRWKPWQRPSSKLIAGFVGVVLPAALLSPLILSFSRKFSSGFWNRPSFAELRAIFPQLFPDALLLLALIMLWIVLSAADDEDTIVKPMAASESIGWLFLCIPLAGFFLAELGTNAFFSRYFMCVLPGVAVAFSCLLWRNFGKDYRVALGVFVLLAGWGVGKQMAVARNPQSVEATGIREFLSIESSLRAEGKRYMVFYPPLIFSEAQYYSSHPDDCILLLPPDFDQPDESLSSSPDPYLHQRLLVNLSQFYPMQFWRLYNLKAEAQDVALIEPSQSVLDALQKAGFQVQVRSAAPLKVVYLH